MSDDNTHYTAQRCWPAITLWNLIRFDAKRFAPSRRQRRGHPAKTTSRQHLQLTSCIAVSFAEGALSLLPVLIKKLYAQEVSLFCVFKTGAGVAYEVICFFRPGAPSRNLLLFFQNAACRAVPGDRAPRAAIKPAATAHQSAN